MSETIATEQTTPFALTQKASPKLRLRHNVSWMLAGYFVNAACQWGILVVLARLGNPEAVGAYALIVAITQPVFAFCSLELRSVQVTDARSEFSVGDYLSFRLLTTSVAVIVIAAIACAPISLGVPTLALFAFACVQALDALSDVAHGQLQQREIMGKIARSLILRGFLSLVVLATTYAVTHILVAAIFSLMVVRVVVLLTLDAPALIELCNREGLHFRVHLNPGLLTPLLRMAIPFAILAGLVAFRTSIPRLLIYYCLGERELGIFAVTVALIAPIEMVTRAMYQSAFPRMAKNYIAGEFIPLRLLLRRLWLLTGFLVVLVIVCALAFGQFVIKQVFCIACEHTAIIVIGMTFVAGLRAVSRPAGFVGRAARRILPLIAIQVCGLLIALTAGIALISSNGLVGIVWSQILAAVFTTAALGVFLHFHISPSFSQSKAVST